MRKIHAFVACLFVTALVVAGCSSNEVPPQPAKPVAWILNDGSVNNTSKQVIQHCNRPDNRGVLLTFDDQGTDQQIYDILERLRHYNIRAAFFPTGQWAQKHLYLIDQMKAEGHMIGNHTYSHVNLKVLSDTNESAFYGEIHPVEGVINTQPMLLRPPYGEGAYDTLMRSRLTEKKIQVCTWTADTLDWNGDGVEVMMDRLRNGYVNLPPLGPDGVILMHMGGQYTPRLIDAIVDYLKQMHWKYDQGA